MIARILCLVALIAIAGCAALDEGYTTNYGLTNTEDPQARSNPVDESYGGGTVGIQRIEEYDEKYQRQDLIDQGEPTEPVEQ